MRRMVVSPQVQGALDELPRDQVLLLEIWRRLEAVADNPDGQTEPAK